MNENNAEVVFQAALQGRGKRGTPPLTFEQVKPVIVALLNKQSLTKLAKETDMNVQTVHKRKLAALEYLDPNNTKRVMTEGQLEWVMEQFMLAQKKQS
jgi:hypothetical protein